MTTLPDISRLYQTIRPGLESVGDILEIVKNIESDLERLDRESVITNFNYVQLENRFGLFAADPNIIRAFVLNIEKMRGVQRKDGNPYAVHPICVAGIIAQVLEDNDETRKAIVYALLHDYIEEGDGKNRAAMDELNRDFPQIPQIGEISLLLSEPEFSFKEVSKDYDWNMIEGVALVEQFKMKCNAPMYNSAWADKIDNMHSNTYIFTQYNTSEKITWKLSKKEAFYRFFLENMKGNGDERLWQILEHSINTVSAELQIPKNQTQTKLETYFYIQKTLGDVIREKIKLYHQKLGIL